MGAKRGMKRFGPKAQFALAYVPVDTAWAIPANAPAAVGMPLRVVAEAFAATAMRQASAAGPWNPDGAIPEGRDEGAIVATVSRALRAAAKAHSPDAVVLLPDAPGAQAAVMPREEFRSEWNLTQGGGACWRVARPSGEPIEAALDRVAGRFVLEGGEPVPDPVAFTHGRAARVGDELHVMEGSLTGHLCILTAELARAGEIDHVQLAHLDALWRATASLAACHPAFAADHAAFEDIMPAPFDLAMRVLTEGDAHGIAAEEVAARLAHIAHTPAAEAYCLHAGIGLGRVATRERDPEPACWTDFDAWLAALAPGSSFGPDAFRTTLMLEAPGAVDGVERFEARLDEPIAEAAAPDGMRLSLRQADGFTYLIGEMHPNYEIVGWTSEAPGPRALH